MKRIIHLGMCCLLANAMLHTSHISCEKEIATVEVPQESFNKEGMVNGAVETISGLIGIIQNAKADTQDSQKKPLILQSVGRMFAGILNFAASAIQKGGNVSHKDIECLRTKFTGFDAAINNDIRLAIAQNARSMNHYLRTVSIATLEEMLNRAEEDDTLSDIGTLDEQDQELQVSILGSLHDMLHDLFALFHNPEDTDLEKQSVADILASILDIATQALKYEYLTSKDAEENVAKYLDTFSTELTKEIRHLMLQTALNLRGECNEITRSGCCKTNCCKTSCSKTSSCKSSCQKTCKTSCCKTSSCKPCCRSTNIDENEATRSCNSCKPKCSSSCKKDKCSSSCKTDKCSPCCKTTATVQTTNLRATPTDDEITRSCNSCKPKCSSSCKKDKCSSSCKTDKCNPCCKTTATVQTTNLRATPTDDEATRSCNSCKPKCSSSCKKDKCSSSCKTSCCKKSTEIDRVCKAKSSTESTRSCNPCKKEKCSSSCKTSCKTDKCNPCCKTKSITADDETTRSCKPCKPKCDSPCKKDTCKTSCKKDACKTSCKPCCTTKSITSDDETTRSCKPCKPKCDSPCKKEKCKTSCKKDACKTSCKPCCTTKSIVADDETTRSCKPCKPKCDSPCKKDACKTSCKKSAEATRLCKAKSSSEATRSCKPCKKEKCSSSCKTDKCNKTCGTTKSVAVEDKEKPKENEETDEVLELESDNTDATRGRQLDDRSGTLYRPFSCNASSAPKITVRCDMDCQCDPCTCTPIKGDTKCGCTKPKPKTTGSTTIKRDTKCGCNKLKPKTSKDQAISKKDSRCGCSSNDFSKQPSAKRPIRQTKPRGVRAEQSYTHEEAHRLAAIQTQHRHTVKNR